MERVEQLLPVEALTSRPGHHYYGYYDKTPWDGSQRFLLAMETSFMDRQPCPGDVATVGMVDLQANGEWVPLGETRSWNWQQGCMLQWLPSAPERLVVYNALEGERYVSAIQDVHNGESRTLPRPVYAVSRDGRRALSLTFPRVHTCRPGYGYVGLPDPWANELAPDADGIYLMDLETGESRLVVSIARIAATDPRPDMDGAMHYFNHLQFNTDDSRFLFLHRWRRGDGRRTRLFTAAPDGSDVFCVADHEMISHFDWRDGRHILAWARQHGRGDFYYLFTDRSRQIELVGEKVLTEDGHCSYSPDRRWILTDTYPDAESHRSLILYNPEKELRVDVGRFFSPPELQGPIRCDLHPRWSRDGARVCFDSAHEGRRNMYIMDVSAVVGAPS
jgi:hypothetical protein